MGFPFRHFPTKTLGVFDRFTQKTRLVDEQGGEKRNGDQIYAIIYGAPGA
jgi:hypothetical protein